MTYEKLPGVYFSESVEINPNFEQEYTPLFIVQSSIAMEAQDNQIVEYGNYYDFYDIARTAHLYKTYAYIKDIMLESGKESFYVYSVKTDTPTGFTDAIKNSAHLTDVTHIIFIEENKSAQANSLQAKITAIKNGVHDNAENGVFREAYIVPYGTVNDAVTNAENTTSEAAALASLTTITTGEGDGRVCVVVPDSMAGPILGKIVGCAYDEEPGYTEIGLLRLDNTYNFDAQQMLALQNQGIIFAKPEKVRGVTQYRINLGVTTSFKESAGDGLIVSRTITDEVLRRIAFECQGFVKARASATNLATCKSVLTTIINDFVKEETVYKDGTSLTVVDQGNSTFVVTGTIKPATSVIAIEVNTVVA